LYLNLKSNIFLGDAGSLFLGSLIGLNIIFNYNFEMSKNYYAVENTGFKARPFRTQGTYSKYSGIDDKIDDLHFYTTFIKFGIGRATYDAAQEIRNRHLTREEGQALVNRFDGEFPGRYFNEIMEYIDMDPEYFHKLCDKFRSPHLWVKDAEGNWKLRHNVAGTGLND
jgi:hypothetical protein